MTAEAEDLEAAVRRLAADHLSVLELLVPGPGALPVLPAGRPSWHRDALCREHPTVSFFPERGENSEPAKAICRACRVVGDCRAWAAEQDRSLAGIWGGLSARERRQRRAGR